MKRIPLLLFFLCACTLAYGQATTTYLHCGRVLDGNGGEMEGLTIVVEGKEIVRIAEGYLGTFDELSGT
ncbi:MAG: hypothetical protein AAF597_02270, partial [Bacteroidota bacterium]